MRSRWLNSSKSMSRSRLSPLVLGREIWVGQVSPQVVEKPIAVGSRGIFAFSSEDPELIEWIDPITGSNACPWAVANVWVDYRTRRSGPINARLADGGRTFDPN